VSKNNDPLTISCTPCITVHDVIQGVHVT